MSTALLLIQVLNGLQLGVLLFLVIYVVPHGARQVAIFCQQAVAKYRKR